MMPASSNTQSEHRPNGKGIGRVPYWLREGVPSWVGSLLVHSVLFLLLLLLAPQATRNRSAPGGEHVTENVGIVFAPAGSGNASRQPATQQSAADIVSQHIAELAPRREMPDIDIPIIGITQNTGSPDGTGTETSSQVGGSSDSNGNITVSFMGARGTGRNFVYVLDRSSSTGYGNRRSPLYVAKNELLASLQSFGEAGLRESKAIRFQVIFFNNTTAVFNTVGYGGSDKSGQLLRYDQAAFQKLQHFLGGILAEGGTRPEPALLDAIRMGADCIFFMTDGDTRITPAQLQRINDAARGAQINVVEYGTGNRKRNSNLQKLAADNHGNYVFVDLSKLPR